MLHITAGHTWLYLAAADGSAANGHVVKAIFIVRATALHHNVGPEAEHADRHLELEVQLV